MTNHEKFDAIMDALGKFAAAGDVAGVRALRGSIEARANDGALALRKTAGQWELSMIDRAAGDGVYKDGDMPVIWEDEGGPREVLGEMPAADLLAVLDKALASRPAALN